MGSLVDAGLAGFHGPALLVSNNSIFTEKDFQSLQRLGDSRKLQEKIATGKFGLGFSSVTAYPLYLLFANWLTLIGVRMD
jgi:sacsin